jgi:hypothetical protein
MRLGSGRAVVLLYTSRAAGPTGLQEEGTYNEATWDARFRNHNTQQGVASHDLATNGTVGPPSQPGLPPESELTKQAKRLMAWEAREQGQSG